MGTKLKEIGYTIKQPTQEHSHVAYMWQRITNPDVLIYLDVDYPNMRARRPHHDGGQQRLDEQHQRLAHAREHCHFYIDTSELTPGEVKTAVLTFLKTI
ncbi:MAG: hypothetical protein GY943_09445 [Chloroflexi bacterium]|nr:hypothetical protein [Chloroflexota bacterium]